MKFNKISFLLLLSSILFFACNKESNLPSEDFELVKNDTVAMMQRLYRRMLVDYLCDTDTLTEGRVCYIPRHGEVLDELTPTVRYIGVDSLKEAQRYFKFCLSLPPTEGEERSEEEYYTVCVDDCSLEFKESNTPDEIARLTIDCPELKDVLTEIVFIPSSLWPSNDRSTPFAFGSLWKKRVGDKDWYYICVSECGQGHKGIMLTFDGGWSEDKFSKHMDTYGGISSFTISYNCASSAAIYGFKDLIENKPTRFIEMAKAFDGEKSSETGILCLRIAERLQTKRLRLDEVIAYGNHQWDTDWEFIFFPVFRYWYVITRPCLYITKPLGITTPSLFCSVLTYGKGQYQTAETRPTSSFEFGYDFDNKTGSGWTMLYR